MFFISVGLMIFTHALEAPFFFHQKSFSFHVYLDPLTYYYCYYSIDLKFFCLLWSNWFFREKIVACIILSSQYHPSFAFLNYCFWNYCFTVKFCNVFKDFFSTFSSTLAVALQFAVLAFHLLNCLHPVDCMVYNLKDFYLCCSPWNTWLIELPNIKPHHFMPCFLNWLVEFVEFLLGYIWLYLVPLLD